MKISSSWPLQITRASRKARLHAKTLTMFIAPALLAFASIAAQAAINITVSNTDTGAVNPYTWGVNAPDQWTNYAGNANFKSAISNAGIKIVRINIIPKCLQDGNDPYPSTSTWNYTEVDSLLNTVFDAGAIPIFEVVGFPAGVPHTLDASNNITSANWTAYATFIQGVVQRYNVTKALGATRTIKYWEMWNEPTDEGHGKFTSQANYGTFVQTVGTAMKSIDSTITLLGPVDSKADFGTGSWLNYTAKNLSSQIDILTWHNYGVGAGYTDQYRLNGTQQAYDFDPSLIVETGNSGILTSPGGSTFPAALTEYNLCSDTFGNDAEFSNEYGSTYVGSAIINAMLGNVTILTYFTSAQAGLNILGLLNDTTFAVQAKAYYVFQLFGTHFASGDRKLSVTTPVQPVECTAAYSSTTGRRYIAVVNKDVANGVTYNFTVNGVAASGTVNAWLVDSSNNGTLSTSSYASNAFSFTVAPRSFVVFEVIPASGNTHAGTWAAREIATATPTYANISQVRPCAAGATYVASVWVKGSGAVQLSVKNGSWGTDITNVRCNATSTWQKVSTAAFSTGTNTQLTFILQDQYGSAGTAYIDDCFLGVSGGSNILTNAGFESGNTSWGTVASPFSILNNP